MERGNFSFFLNYFSKNLGGEKEKMPKGDKEITEEEKEEEAIGDLARDLDDFYENPDFSLDGMERRIRFRKKIQGWIKDGKITIKK